MRILLLSALLAATASCAAPPPQIAAPASSPPAVASAQPATSAVGAPTPLAAPAAAAVPVKPESVAVAAAAPAKPDPGLMAAQAANGIDYRPIVLIWVDMLNSPRGPAPGRLTLSNFEFDAARVQAVATRDPKCGVPQGAEVSNFVVPLNGTRVIAPPRGADVCWRREIADGPERRKPGAPPWTEWSRAFTSSGHSIDSRL